MMPRVSPNRYVLAQLRQTLRPIRLHWFPRVRSTNSHAAELRRRGELFAPAVVVTGHQTDGRGRGGNSWFSSEGSMTATFVFAVEEHLSPLQLPLVAGLAVRNAAAELCGYEQIELKWPNDVLVHGRKLAGLLCERVHKADLIGVGLNVNVEVKKAPRELRERIVSLSELVGRPIDMNLALATVGRHLHRTLSRRNETPYAQLLLEYERHHALTGKRVMVSDRPGEPVVSGRCEGIDQLGRLLIRDRKTLHHVIAGHVVLG